MWVKPMDNTCVCYGEIIPKGRMVCPQCEIKSTIRKGGAITKKIKRKTIAKELLGQSGKSFGAKSK